MALSNPGGVLLQAAWLCASEGSNGPKTNRMNLIKSATDKMYTYVYQTECHNVNSFS